MCTLYSATMGPKSHPITPKQKELLVEFISARKEMYTGKLTPIYTRDKMTKYWEHLTTILNSVPDGPAKEWKQWRKSWVDIKKNIKARHSEKKKYLGGTGGGPPFIPPPGDDIPAIEEKVLTIITPVAISGNDKVLESEVCFDFNSDSNIPFELEKTSKTIIDFENLIGENVPEPGDNITVTGSYSKECEANTSKFIEDLHSYCARESTSIPQKPDVAVTGKTKFQNRSANSCMVQKKMNKSSRLQQSLRNNERFLKISEESVNFDREYKKNKILLLEKKNMALETIANSYTQMAMDIREIKNVMVNNENH